MASYLPSSRSGPLSGTRGASPCHKTAGTRVADIKDQLGISLLTATQMQDPTGRIQAKSYCQGHVVELGSGWLGMCEENQSENADSQARFSEMVDRLGRRVPALGITDGNPGNQRLLVGSGGSCKGSLLALPSSPIQATLTLTLPEGQVENKTCPPQGTSDPRTGWGSFSCFLLFEKKCLDSVRAEGNDTVFVSGQKAKPPTACPVMKRAVR